MPDGNCQWHDFLYGKIIKVETKNISGNKIIKCLIQNHLSFNFLIQKENRRLILILACTIAKPNSFLEVAWSYKKVYLYVGLLN